MKLIAQIKLEPTIGQAQSLEKTMRQVNAACNYISNVAWDEKVFGRRALRDRVYREVREKFDLGAQIAQHAAFKVADAYRIDYKTKRDFRPLGSITYDQRILSWATDKQFISIWTIDGRLKISFAMGKHQRHLLESAQGESDLIFRQGEFYIHQVCDVDEPAPFDPEGWIGIDTGVVNIATDSDGAIYTSEAIEHTRQRQQALRASLQARGSLSAKRHLRKLSDKQHRFQKDSNHVLSKRIVAKAAHTKRGIALEDLTGIHARTRVRGKEQRSKHSNWSFAQLRTFLTYKAKLMGVPLSLINPRYTSQRCFACGHIEKDNRKSQSEFLCRACGHTDHADINAAKNISMAAVNRPIVSDALIFIDVVPETSPHALAVGR